jgi:hypothetical protein
VASFARESFGPYQFADLHPSIVQKIQQFEAELSGELDESLVLIAYREIGQSALEGKSEGKTVPFADTAPSG